MIVWGVEWFSLNFKIVNLDNFLFPHTPIISPFINLSCFSPHYLSWHLNQMAGI